MVGNSKAPKEMRTKVQNQKEKANLKRAIKLAAADSGQVVVQVAVEGREDHGGPDFVDVLIDSLADYTLVTSVTLDLCNAQPIPAVAVTIEAVNLDRVLAALKRGADEHLKAGEKLIVRVFPGVATVVHEKLNPLGTPAGEEGST